VTKCGLPSPRDWRGNCSHTGWNESTARAKRPVKKIVAIVSPAKLNLARELLARVGVDGMTVSSVLGFGEGKGHTEQYRSAEHQVSFQPRVKIEIVVEDGRVPPLVHELVRVMRTGSIGDGQIFVVPVSEAIRIRTDERGSDAI